MQEPHAAEIGLFAGPSKVAGQITVMEMEDVGRKLLTIAPNFTEEDFIEQFIELVRNLLHGILHDGYCHVWPELAEHPCSLCPVRI